MHYPNSFSSGPTVKDKKYRVRQLRKVWLNTTFFNKKMYNRHIIIDPRRKFSSLSFRYHFLLWRFIWYYKFTDNIQKVHFHSWCWSCLVSRKVESTNQFLCLTTVLVCLFLPEAKTLLIHHVICIINPDLEC